MISNWALSRMYYNLYSAAAWGNFSVQASRKIGAPNS